MRSLLLLLIATTALAQAPPVVAPSPVTPGDTHVLPTEGNSVAVLISREHGSIWRALAIDFVNQRIAPVMPTTYDDGKQSICIVEGPAGSQVAITRFKDNVQYETNVVTLGARPLPKPPVVKPEDPANPPNPADPTLPLKGLRVMILEERNPTSPLPPTLQRALQSPAVYQYLDSKAPGRWRRFDPTSSLSNLSKEWQVMRAAVPSTTVDQPQIIVAGSSGGAAEKVHYVGPYPDDEAKVLELLKKFGG